MRENRTYGSEGGEPSNGSLPYPYQTEHTCSAAFQCCVLAPRMIGIMRYRLNTTRSAAFQCCGK